MGTANLSKIARFVDFVDNGLPGDWMHVPPAMARDVANELRMHLADLRILADDLQAATGADPLKPLIARFHPDKNPNGLDANEVTAALIEVRNAGK